MNMNDIHIELVYLICIKTFFFYFSTENKHVQGLSKRQHRPRWFKSSTCSTSSTTRGEGWHSSSQHSCSLWPACNIWCRRQKLGRLQVSRQCSQVTGAEWRGARQPEWCQQVWGWFRHRRQEEDTVRHRRDETGDHTQTPSEVDFILHWFRGGYFQNWPRRLKI